MQEPESRSAHHGRAEATPPPAAPTRWYVRIPMRVLHGMSLAGWSFALLAFASSMTPSLVPRAWYLQGLISGLLVTLAYGMGVMLSWLLRRVGFTVFDRPDVRRSVFRFLVVVSLVVLPLFGYLGARWQFQVRELVGMDPSDSYYYALMLSIAATFFWVVVSLVRMSWWSARAIGRRLGRWIPLPIAKFAGVGLVAVLAITAVDEALLPFIARGANASFSLADAGTPPGAVARDVPQRSGSPASAIRWDDLGYEGRAFIAAGPTAADLARFSGTPAVEPVRVYVGLKSAPTLQDQARLAVAELERSGGFDRSVLAVVTPTGRGWINHSGAAALEYIWNGDTAIVSMQYSYLSSAAAFLTDLRTPEQAAKILFDAVHAEWEKRPAAHRPTLIVTGESLGAFGSQAPFGSIDTLLKRADGAVWVGGPRFTPLWQQVTERRRPGSPIQHPDIDGCTEVCFVTQVGDLPAGRHPKVVYVQHINDPVVWWSDDLILHKPEWLSAPPLAGRTSAMRWAPAITFWQVTADMAVSAETPDGYGHFYGQIYADAYAALAPSPGWTDQDTHRLRDLLLRLDTGV